MADSIEQLSYELSANALAEQERSVTAIRTRAGTIIAAASIAGSFLGTKVNHGSLNALAIAAMVAFALCLGSAIVVLLPHDFVFAFAVDQFSPRAITVGSGKSLTRIEQPDSGSSSPSMPTAGRSTDCRTGSPPVACCSRSRSSFGPSASRGKLSPWRRLIHNPRGENRTRPSTCL